MKVSVAICTWNRSALLDRTLQSMHALQIPESVTWELIVVNNNCSDDTDTVLAAHARCLPIVRLFEARPGKSFAANLAAARAQGELLIWTDDDVLVDPLWLAEYVKAARQWPDAGYFAGPIDPHFELEPPKWIRAHLAELTGVYVIVDHGPVPHEMARGQAIFGANMAFRSELARAFPLNEDLGRIRGQLIGADDTELIERVRKAGFRGMWVPGARLRHFSPAARLTKKYVMKWYHDAGRSFVRQGRLKPARRIAGMPAWVLRQYLEAQTKRYLLAARGGAQWFEWFRKATTLRGVLHEARTVAGLHE